LCHYGYRAGAGAAGGTGDEQEGIRLKEPLGGSYRIDNLIGVFSGDFGAQLIYLAHSVAAGLAASDEDSVLIITFYTGQSAQVSRIRVHGVGTGDNINTALGVSFFIQLGKLISNPAAALPETHDY